MIRAFVFLELTSLRNGFVQRLRRLRQPRYLLGAAVGALYMYFTFFRHLAGPNNGNHFRPPTEHLSPAAIPLLEPLGALILLTFLFAAWIFPSGRATLNFTEAEIAFLFPAPVSRRTLIHFKLIRAQLGVFVSSVFLALVAQRVSPLGGSGVVHVLGWWLVLAFIHLHLLAAAFTRDRLFDAGVTHLQRRAFFILLFGALVFVIWRWIQSAPLGLALADATALPAVLHGLFDLPVLRVVLWPLRLLLRPFFAADSLAFLAALPAALLLFALQYAWVIKAETRFEEASIARAAKRARQVAERRAGEPAVRRGSIRLRKEPFTLRPLGPRALAFYWKTLLDLPALAQPKSFGLLFVLLMGAMCWMLAHPGLHSFARGFAMGVATLGGYAMLLAPAVFRRNAQRLLDNMDVFKAYPVSGWEVVAGELSCPVVLVCLLEWTVLAVVGVAAASGVLMPRPQPGLILAAAAGIALLIPPVAGLLFTINFAAILYFPAWISSRDQSGPGVERLGQRLIFVAGYAFVLLVALVPAVALGGGAFLLGRWLFSLLVLPAIAGALLGASILAVELALVIRWLGRRYDTFDLTSELPR